MDAALELLRQAGAAASRLLLQPFTYISILLIGMMLARQTRLERRLFYVRLTFWPKLLGPAMLYGIAAGIVVSAALLLTGVSLNGEAVYWLWGASLLLMLVRIRFLSIIYGAALVALLQWALGRFELAGSSEWYGPLAASLEGQDAAGLLLIASLLQLAEAALVAWRGPHGAGPLVVDGKRGRLVGGYQLQTFWPVPLLLLVPSGTADMALPWTPLAAGGADGWAMLGLPVMIGFSGLTTSLLPREKAHRASVKLLLSGAVAAALAMAALRWPPFVPVAAVAALLLRELMCQIERRREEQTPPLYVQDDRGLRVLAVVPGTPADQMGIQAGEILHKVNGIRVRSQEDLYEGLLENSAFSKLEVLNLEGQLKFVRRARFEGEHHQLGVVLAPDEKTMHVTCGVPRSLFDLIRQGGGVRKRGKSSVRL
ncbi:serine protease [Paenibacillus darwinianus]|uniref:Serine protease n=2 Tax=Paenibacillus darwinianus TaxID=1380763 RepID=A0A9W5S0T3_9BACL|nr:PDZ domain-containing protein [Paenibacillus darwinianus]EXX89027.1 serine protease [Paenibacillus darwinianus]EXX89347.1 serine protease [Paenibacillus darwinianus]